MPQLGQLATSSQCVTLYQESLPCGGDETRDGAKLTSEGTGTSSHNVRYNFLVRAK